MGSDRQKDESGAQELPKISPALRGGSSPVRGFVGGEALSGCGGFCAIVNVLLHRVGRTLWERGDARKIKAHARSLKGSSHLFY
jgi:hypothetical protein